MNEIGWTAAEYAAAPEAIDRLHTHILNLEDALAILRLRLRHKLSEMELHDATGDPHDEGYMQAIREIREVLDR